MLLLLLAQDPIRAVASAPVESAGERAVAWGAMSDATSPYLWVLVAVAVALVQWFLIWLIDQLDRLAGGHLYPKEEERARRRMRPVQCGPDGRLHRTLPNGILPSS